MRKTSVLGRSRVFCPLALVAALLASVAHSEPLERPNPDGRLNPAEPVSLKIRSPEMDEVLKDSQVEVQFEVSNFDMRPGGPHLHVILDNLPYWEHFDAERPFFLDALQPGTHILAAFPVTTWHESWKDSESLALVRFHVGHQDSKPAVDLSQPLLVFNMPQGSVRKWAGQWVLFDFLVPNAEMIQGTTQLHNCRVRYVLDGASALVEYQESRYWIKLKEGDHRIEVALTDPYGRYLPNGTWNRVRRIFRVIG